MIKAMPFAFALLSVEQGGRPLLVVPTIGIALGKATAALRQFPAHVSFDTVGRRAKELSLPSVAVVHYKLLPGNAVTAAVLCEPWENPYEGKESIHELETVGSLPTSLCEIGCV